MALNKYKVKSEKFKVLIVDFGFSLGNINL